MINALRNRLLEPMARVTAPGTGTPSPAGTPAVHFATMNTGSDQDTFTPSSRQYGSADSAERHLSGTGEGSVIDEILPPRDAAAAQNNPFHNSHHR